MKIDCLYIVLAGSLSYVLQAVLLLLNLWTSSRHKCDNRYSSNLISAPLIPLLRRFQDITAAKPRIPRNEDVSILCFARNVRNGVDLQLKSVQRINEK